MASVFTPKEGYRGLNTKPSVFLAGSIELGKARDWHAEVIANLESTECSVFSPRTDDATAWNSIDLTVASPELSSQVVWEQLHLEAADMIFFYLQEGTYSPVSMLEYGQMLAQPKKKIVYIDPGFYRRGNLLITSQVSGNNVYIHLSFNDAVKQLNKCLSS